MPPPETRQATAIAASASATSDGAEDTLATRAKASLSGADATALIAALNENITHQRDLNDTIKEAFTQLASRPPSALMDHDAFATALAPLLARAVDRASGPKKIDPGRPGTEPFRSFSRLVFKPLPTAAEIKESEVFDLNQFDPQVRRENLQRLLYSLKLCTNDHARHVVDHIAAHLARADLTQPASRVHDVHSMARRDCGHQPVHHHDPARPSWRQQS